MISIIRAEWIKSFKYTRLMVALVWFYPIMAAIVLIIGILASLFSKGFAAYMQQSLWNEDILAIWGMINTFPGNIFTRIPLLAYMAVMFAGEFEWGTWKNIIPPSQRASLIIAKLITLTGIIIMSLIATSAVIVLFNLIAHALEGIPYGPPISGRILSDLIQVYFFEIILSILSILILGSFIAIAAMLTRSIIGSMLLGLGLSLVDLLSVGLFMILGNLFNRQNIVNLFRFTPSYNLENVRSWFLNNTALSQVPPGFNADLTLASSSLLLIMWIISLLAFIVWLFQRQDITT